MRSVGKPKKTTKSALGGSPLNVVAALTSVAPPVEDAPPPSEPAAPLEPASAREIAGNTSTPTTGVVRDAPAQAAKPKRKKRARTTLAFDAEVLELVRDTVVALSGPPHQMTLTYLIETGLLAEVKRLQDLYNNGERFPRRTTPLRTGRPLLT